MLHDTQLAIAPALHELLSTVSALRNDILAESEELYNSWHPRIERSGIGPERPESRRLPGVAASRFAGAAGRAHALGAVVTWPQRVACHRYARRGGRLARLYLRGNAHRPAGLP